MMKLKDAATILQVSPAFLNNERMRGNIGYIKLGRLIFFNQQILDEYLDKCTITAKNSDSLATTGYRKGRAASNGAAPGTALKADKQSANLLAQQMFKSPRSRSTNGSAGSAQ
jgi:hypothetical protein